MSPVSEATVVQSTPLRTASSTPVLPEVLRLLRDYPKVQADYRARIELGVVRYGSELCVHNGRCFLADAYQEALDLLGYLVGLGMERPEADEPQLHALARATAHALSAVLELRMLLDQQRISA